MEIKITLSEETIDKLLKMKGYVVEDILVHYPKFHYTTEGKYGKAWIKIVYLANGKPKVLDNDIIMIKDVENMKFDKVVNNLFNEVLVEKLLN